MPIMRKQKVNRYTTVDNYLIDDKRLDPEGKGYLIYMLRKPDNWHLDIFWNGIVWIENKYPFIKYAIDEPSLYDIEGKKTLVFPGAYSPDKDYRLKNGYSWFPTEQMNEHEKFMGKTLLDVCGNEVDFILSHTCPRIFEPYISDLFFSSVDQSKVDKTTEI